jgi:EpsI family protein
MNAVRSLFKRRAMPIAIAVLLLQTVFYYNGSAKETTPSIAPWRAFPREISTWKETAELTLESEVLETLQPDDYLARAYAPANGGLPLTLFIGYFNSRRDGRAPHSPQWCLPGAGWKSVYSKVIDVPLPNSGKFSANEYLIEKDLSRELVYYWYHQGGRTVASEVVAQIYSIPDLILHGRTDVALVRIIVPVPGNDTNIARAEGIDFAQAVYPLIREHIH